MEPETNEDLLTWLEALLGEGDLDGAYETAREIELRRTTLTPVERARFKRAVAHIERILDSDG